MATMRGSDVSPATVGGSTVVGDPMGTLGGVTSPLGGAVGGGSGLGPVGAYDERWESLSGTAYRGPDWSDRSREAYWDDKGGPGPRVMAAGTLEGDNVVNTAEEDLGKIKSIMIDVASGRIAYAVLSSGGFLGIGDKLFAIPWNALRLDADNHRFILDVPADRLKNAPGFDKDAWPTMADQQWADDVHNYYNARPYWE